MSIILCGMPGSGKTSVGQLLAKKLGLVFYDTDKLLEGEYQAATGVPSTCREISRRHDEEQFRQWESHVIFKLLLCPPAVIATGGGTLLPECNQHLLKSLGKIVYLDVPQEVLLKRILTKGMPTYLDPDNPHDSFVKLLYKRKPIYEQHSDATISCDMLAPSEISENIHKQVNSFSTKLHSQ